MPFPSAALRRIQFALSSRKKRETLNSFAFLELSSVQLAKWFIEFGNVAGLHSVHLFLPFSSSKEVSELPYISAHFQINSELKQKNISKLDP